MSEKTLLITIVDTNPIWWGLQGSGLIKGTSIQKANGSLNGSEQTNVSLIYML